MLLQVKYGLIRLINQEADLCEQIKSVGLECPLKKGQTNFTKDVEIPKEIPPVYSCNVENNRGCLLTHGDRASTTFWRMFTPRMKGRSLALKLL